MNPVEHIGRMASICYDSNREPEACIKRASKCKDSGHLATMRFAFATFNVSGISRICSHQIVRMAHAGILQRSQRYVKETGIQFVRPPSLRNMPDRLRLAWSALETASRAVYESLLEAGMKKEDARFALLAGSETELNLCLNFQAWQDFLHNRTGKHAQWEVRAVALEIERQLNALAPELFSLTEES